ncbi:unnamed protein product [Kluyveromyces dobzhanskii CBS 2104]|uniref:Sodium/hydrogen exchanger n=1 Tax=Kluyveromyces dobzhanskii CBS 2104 TaxID=1427455 RepID=A0A0A8L1T2_9SACH|nr:unnamed protein product [Kluyveromyces dobzhanskii CBS 2104]
MKSTLIGIVLWAFRAQLIRASSEGDPLDDGAPVDETPIPDDPEDVNPITEEMFSSWALFILLFLLIAALWSSYMLTRKRVRAVHETVLSIFYGMLVGLIIRLTPGHYIQDTVTFNSSYFFNVLLPPIILNSGYELNQANFFNNIVSILTFAIPGTLISAVVLGTILFLWTSLGLEGINISFVDALSVGATLSATDPVTILSIFNAYKVDPKLYTIIFGESLLNDAISIVMFETCQKFHGKKLQFSSFFEGIGMFLMTFTVSLLIGCMIGMLVALLLKHTYIRRYPQIESCIILLVAYQSYFFSNGCHMSGIVSLLFCGITLKHYAYYNMSRRTQVTLKYIFQLLARLSENFIFIYLGLALFTEVELVYKPMLIIITAISICVARWSAVIPLSNFVNWFYRMKTLRSMGLNANSDPEYSIPDEIPYQYQMMVFWAGLRGAVGVALAMGIQGEFKFTLLATVLVVVVLTVIIFGGTTASMLEILNIKTGCVDENDLSDDEFDIEAPRAISLPASNLNLSTDFRSDFPPLATSANTAAGLVPVDEASTEQTNGSRFSFDGLQIRNSVDKIFQQDQWFANFDEQVLKPVFLDNASALPSQTNTKVSNSPNVLSSRRT